MNTKCHEILQWYKSKIQDKRVEEEIERFISEVCETYRKSSYKVNEEIATEVLFVIVSEIVGLDDYIRSLCNDVDEDVAESIKSESFSLFFNMYYDLIYQKLMDCYIP